VQWVRAITSLFALEIAGFARGTQTALIHDDWHCYRLYTGCIQQSSEVRLDPDGPEGDVDCVAELGNYSSGTRIAKQSDNQCFERAIRRYDAEAGLYWVS
jgi:hypothetical protein